MKKRGILSIIAILVCLPFALCGCGGDTPTAPADSAFGSNNLTITSAEYEGENIRIRYPQITGLSDETKQTALNELIKNDVWDYTAKPAVDAYSLQEVTCDVEYTVTLQTENLLSILYTGSASIENSMHASKEIYSATFDLKRAEKLALSDFVTIDVGFIYNVQHADTITAYDGKAQEELAVLVQSLSIDEMVVGFTEQLGQNYYTFHLTPDSLIVSVPTTHAAGDYALITLAGKYTR